MSRSPRKNINSRIILRVAGIVLVLLAVLAPIQPAGAVPTEVLDQDVSGVADQGADVVQGDFGQTFTPELTGPLRRVEINVDIYGGTSPSWIAEIREVNANGEPFGDVLATTSRPPMSGTVDQWLSFTFDDPATVTAGARYGLRIKAFDGLAIWRGRTDNPCAGGRLFGVGLSLAIGNDAFFRTYVEIDVPDTTPPVIIPHVNGTLGANGWYTSDVAIDWEITDPEAPITERFGCEAVTISADTAGLTLNCSATSEGGTAFQSVTIKRDATPPAITGASAPEANHNGWNNSDVTVSFTCGDVLSGIQSCPQDTILNADTVTGPRFIDGVAVDQAGNQASVSVGPIMIDKMPPSLSGAPTTSPNAEGWYNGNVVIDWTCSDGLSGIDGNCPADSTITGEGIALSVNAHVLDHAGNLTAASSFPGVNIDRTSPSVAVTGVADGASYLLGAVPAAGCSTADNLSGVAANATLSISGGNGNGVGVFTARCSGARDQAGNSAQASVTYMVGYTIEGFSAPVHPGVLNLAKAGQSIPLKWRLLDANGAPVTNLSASAVKVFVQSLSCDGAGTATDEIEEYAAGTSGLQNLGDGYYQFNWQSPKSYANSCKTLYVDLAASDAALTNAQIVAKIDAGLIESATFQFKK